MLQQLLDLLHGGSLIVDDLLERCVVLRSLGTQRSEIASQVGNLRLGIGTKRIGLFVRLRNDLFRTQLGGGDNLFIRSLRLGENELEALGGMTIADSRDGRTLPIWL